jgi:hypothetical protein
MNGSRALRGKQRAIAGRGASTVAVALCLLLTSLLAVAPAAGAGLVSKDGRIYACYKLKGKAKGRVRLVAKRGKCRRGERKVAWNAVGQPGTPGETGEGGSNGNNGEGGSGPGAGPGLERQVTNLTSKVNALEGILKGITNGDLTGLLSKLQGIGGPQLQEAVKSVADVNALSAQVGALCSQGKALTTQTQGLGTAISTAEVIGGIGLSILAPKLPAALPAFSCP